MHTGQRLIEHQEGWIDDEVHGQLQEPLLAHGEALPRILAEMIETQPLQPGGGRGLPPDALAAHGRDGEVVPDAQLAEDLHRLERASDPSPRDLVGLEPVDPRPVEIHGARIRPEQIGDQVEDGGLARAVGPDEAHDGRGGDLERALADGAEPPEELAQPRHRQRGRPGGRRRRGRAHAPAWRVTSSPRRTGAPSRTCRPSWRRRRQDRSAPSCPPGSAPPPSGWASGGPRRGA